MPALLVSVDVEEDMPEGRVQAQTTLRNLGALDALHGVFLRLGVRPTYLLTWPVATRPEGAGLADLIRGGRAEFGSLLHPWVTPPFDAHETRLEIVSPHRLTTTALHAKVASLTEAVATRAGARPRVFRAAAGGLNGAVLQAVERHGYAVDCSVLPRVDRRPEGGLDHRDAPDVPYFPDRQCVSRRGGSTVLEIPISVGLGRGLPQGLSRALSHLPDGLLRIGGASVERLSGESSLTALCQLADTLVGRDVPALHLALRSNELLAGESGGARTPDEAHAYVEKAERFLAYALHTLGLVPSTLSEFAALWARGA